MHRMIVLLDLDLWKAFKRACAANDQTASQVIRAMVRKYVDDKPQAALDLVAPKASKKGGKP